MVIHCTVGIIWGFITGVTVLRHGSLRWASSLIQNPFSSRFWNTFTGKLLWNLLGRTWITRWALLYPLLWLHFVFFVLMMCLDFMWPTTLRFLPLEDSEREREGIRMIQGTYFNQLISDRYIGGGRDELNVPLTKDVWLFQYPKKKDACILAAFGSGCLLLFSAPARSRSPLRSWNSLSALIQACGTSLLIETGVRIVGELVWRRWWLHNNSRTATTKIKHRDSRLKLSNRETAETSTRDGGGILQRIKASIWEQPDFEDLRRLDRLIDTRILGPGGTIGRYLRLDAVRPRRN